MSRRPNGTQARSSLGSGQELNQQVRDAAAALQTELVAPWRLDWATLLQRVYDVDTIECPACGSRLSFIETVTDKDEAKALLTTLGFEPDAPAIASRAVDLDLVDPTYNDIDQTPPDWDP